MTTTAQYPGAQNVYVPNHEATGKLVVDFSRNPKDFALNRYAQIVPVDQLTGFYLKMTVEEAGRILETDASELVWPDGNDAPSGIDGTESHLWLQYACKRYAPTARLGNQTIQQATWDIVAKHLAIKAQQQMTVRTQLAVTQLTTTGNYSSSHYSAVASISGNTGNWAASTTARQDIRRSINYASKQILQDTLGAVKPSDLILVMGPDVAQKISECQEIVDYIKGSPSAWASIKGDLAESNPNLLFGLPPTLYGVPLVIEDAAKVTSRKGATKATSFVFPSTSAVMVSRPGGLVGVAGAPSFSSLSIFSYSQEEMAVETWDDINNKRKLGRVIDTMVPVVTAPDASFLFTSAA